MTERKLWLALLILTVTTVAIYTPQPVAAQARAIPIPKVKVQIQPHWTLDRITYYNAVPEQTDDDPFTSACGPNIENQVAISRDIFTKRPPVWEPPAVHIGPPPEKRSAQTVIHSADRLYCGDVIRIWSDAGYLGEFIVWDTTHWRWQGTLDILTDGVYSWGRTRGHAVLIERGTP
jgi:hypothetical protein